MTNPRGEAAIINCNGCREFRPGSRETAGEFGPRLQGALEPSRSTESPVELKPGFLRPVSPAALGLEIGAST